MVPKGHVFEHGSESDAELEVGVRRSRARHRGHRHQLGVQLRPAIDRRGTASGQGTLGPFAARGLRSEDHPRPPVTPRPTAPAERPWTRSTCRLAPASHQFPAQRPRTWRCSIATGNARVEEERRQRASYDIDGLFDAIEEFMEMDRRTTGGPCWARFDKTDGHITMFTRPGAGKRVPHIQVRVKEGRLAGVKVTPPAVVATAGTLSPPARACTCRSFRSVR